MTAWPGPLPIYGIHRLLYARRGVIVTWQRLYTRGQRYEIARLRHVVKTRGSVHAGVIVSIVVAVALAGLVIPLVTTLGFVPGLLLAIPSVLIPCVVAVVCATRWPPRHELWASYEGARVPLFTTRDAQEFGQVSRALQRAIEAAPR